MPKIRAQSDGPKRSQKECPKRAQNKGPKRSTAPCLILVTGRCWSFRSIHCVFFVLVTHLVFFGHTFLGWFGHSIFAPGGASHGTSILVTHVWGDSGTPTNLRNAGRMPTGSCYAATPCAQKQIGSRYQTSFQHDSRIAGKHLQSCTLLRPETERQYLHRTASEMPAARL